MDKKMCVEKIQIYKYQIIELGIDEQTQEWSWQL